MAERIVTPQAGIWPALVRGAKLAGLAGTLLLAACQTMIPKGAPPPEPTAPVEKPVDEPIQPGLPTDANRHRIALLVPMSGPNAGVGQSIANATTMALLDTRTDKLRITTYDTRAGAAAAAQRAVAEGNRLILGPLLSDDVRQVAPIAKRAGVPVVSFSNDVGAAQDGVFLMGFSPTQAIDRVVKFARAKGMTNFAALVPAGTYGERSGQALLRSVQQSGGTVVSLQTFDRTPLSMLAAIRKIDAASDYDAILIADSGRVAVQAAPLIRRGKGAGAQILGTELWNTEGSLAGQPDLRGAWFASVSDTLYGQLATKYRARYGAAPFRLSSLGYDAVLLTVRIAGNWKVGTPFPMARLTDPDGFSGIDGAFRFNRNGIAERALEVSQINAGSFSVVDAAPRGFGQ
ncbi:MAG: penicillin-binding protein activator [Sphingobium sp.]|nr:penicillin-binding protein activator [Sphingobium sp.]